MKKMLNLFRTPAASLVMLVLLSGLMAACSSATPEPVSYTIEMSEFKYTPDTIEAKVGQQVTLNLVNKGALAHEVMFGHNVIMTDGHPDGYKEDMFMMAGVEPDVMEPASEMGDMGMGSSEDMHSCFMVTLPKTGDEASMTFTVTKDMVGEWEIGCFQQEGVHYTAGMVGKFIVSK